MLNYYSTVRLEDTPSLPNPQCHTHIARLSMQLGSDFIHGLC